MSRLHNQPPKKIAIRKLRRLVVPVIVVLVIIGATIFARQFFVVKSITCVMDNSSCPDPVMAELGRLKGKSMFFVETDSLTQKLHAALPKAQSLRFEKKLPNTITLSIISYPSAFFVQVGQQYYLLNSAGHVIDQTDALPVNEYNVTLPVNDLKIGETVDEATFLALASLTTELKKTSLAVQNITFVDPENITLLLADSHSAILKGDDVAAQLATLQRILNEATMSARGHVIDVRFAHPIVRE